MAEQVEKSNIPNTESEVAIGAQSEVSASEVAIGTQPEVSASEVAIGAQSEVSASEVAIGAQPEVSASEVAIGTQPEVSASEVAIGTQPEVSATDATDISVHYDDSVSPYADMTAHDKKVLAVKYILLSVAAMAGIFLSQLFRFIEPLFIYVARGYLRTMFFYIFGGVFLIAFTVAMFFAIKKLTGYNVFSRKTPKLSLKRSLIIYACALVPVFIVSAALGFNLKVVYELGNRVTQYQVVTNAVMYAYGAVRLILMIIIIELVQEAGELLYTGKYCNIIPWGGIALTVICGFLDVLVSHLTGGTMLFAWLYVAFDMLYGIIYLIGKKNFFVAYFVSLIIYIL